MKILKNKHSLSRKSLIGTLIVVTTMAISLPPDGHAMLAPAQVANEVHQINDTRAADLRTIQTALESEIIRQRLAEFNLSPEQINHRLSRLSDAQVHQTARQIRAVNPGGDGGGIVITVLVIAILVALFLFVFRRV